MIAGFLRISQLAFFGLSSDEFATRMIVSGRSFKSIIQTCFVVSQPVPPFYFLLCKPFADCLGTNEIGLRILSVICSTLTVYLIFLIGKSLFNSRIGICAAILCALNTTQILYAQMARPYALCLLLGSISILSFLEWLRKDTFLNQFTYVISTSLLLYSHYVFSPLLVIQGLYFFWCRRFARNTNRTEVNWIILQFAIVLLMMPLLSQGQVINMIYGRKSLEWARYPPQFKDVTVFLKLKYLFFSTLITLLICLPNTFQKKFWQNPLTKPNKEDAGPSVHSLVFLLFWFGVPPLLFYVLYLFTGINLLVERYLILTSLSTYLLIPAVALSIKSYRFGQNFVIVYVLYYAISAPFLSYFKKGHFSQAMPGENQWRQTFQALNNSQFTSSLLLFQSPYIEADQINYSPDTPLFDYLSAPIQSFHTIDTPMPLELLPHHWRAALQNQERFDAKIKGLILSKQEFTLLCDQEFWEEFQCWLYREFADAFDILSVESFSAKVNLRLKKIRLVSRKLEVNRNMN